MTMTRKEFYQELNKAFKETFAPSLFCEAICDDGDLETGQYHISIRFCDLNIYTKDVAFDKYYSIYAKEYWGTQSEIKYTPVDIEITMNNIRHIIISEFDKVILNNKEDDETN